MRAAGGDHVEQVAIIAGRGIGPFARQSAAFAANQTHVQAPSRCIVDIADHPVMAFAAAVREIVAAHRLGIFTETARKFTDGIFHGGDRKSVVLGKSVSVRVDSGGRRIIKQKKIQEENRRRQSKERSRLSKYKNKKDN